MKRAPFRIINGSMVLGALILLFPGPTAYAQARPSLSALQQQVNALEAKITILQSSLNTVTQGIDTLAQVTAVGAYITTSRTLEPPRILNDTPLTPQRCDAGDIALGVSHDFTTSFGEDCAFINASIPSNDDVRAWNIEIHEWFAYDSNCSGVRSVSLGTICLDLPPRH